ncbi:MAG: acyl carrier protein [Epsilonproteobacteria bacterium]|nr:MAG: acyl carrier protein [Campylobacterota bacterium]
MTEAHIMEKLTEILVEEFEVEADEVTPDANFFTDLDMDSLDAIDLIVSMDKALGITLKAEDAQKIRTAGEFVQLILSRV